MPGRYAGLIVPGDIPEVGPTMKPEAITPVTVKVREGRVRDTPVFECPENIDTVADIGTVDATEVAVLYAFRGLPILFVGGSSYYFPTRFPRIGHGWCLRKRGPITSGWWFGGGLCVGLSLFFVSLMGGFRSIGGGVLVGSGVIATIFSYGQDGATYNGGLTFYLTFLIGRVGRSIGRANYSRRGSQAGTIKYI